jgi:hypothetical protein
MSVPSVDRTTAAVARKSRPWRSRRCREARVEDHSQRIRSLGKTTPRSDWPPAHDARVRNRRTDDLGIASLLRGALMREIGSDAAAKGLMKFCLRPRIRPRRWRKETFTHPSGRSFFMEP